MQHLRSYSIELILIITLGVAVVFFGYLGYGLLQPDLVNETFSGARALDTAKTIVEFGPRVTGTGSNAQTGDWLITQLRTLGWDVVIQPFAVREGVEGRNIIAVQSNTKPGAPVILLTTPYDTRLAADADADPNNRQRSGPGANEAASGAAVLLELARVLGVQSTGHTICLAFFDAEQNGGLPGWDANMGSTVFVRGLPASVPRCASPQVVVSLDQVGAPGQVFPQTEGADLDFQASIWQTAANLDYEATFTSTLTSTTDPAGVQAAFAAEKIPTVTISGTGFPLLHTMQDTVDRLSAETLQAAGMTLETWLETEP
ncbi:MAG: M28 family peptidase [Anaerolineales bacterium]|nr:M28 family peptidase [Anaerolineales bacterium]